MDFFSRLIGGGKSKSSSTSNDPKKRLARFQQTYDQLLHAVQKTPALHSDEPALESVRQSFARLTTILHDESRSPAPHLSLSFAASNQIYITIARIASSAYSEVVIREAVAFFSALIDSEEEEFIEHERFAQSLMGFIDRISGTGNDIFIGHETEVEVVELLFGIAAKIRLQPEILPIWFRQRMTESVVIEKEKEKRKFGFAGVTQKEDFPLCYQLIDHVHHGGRIGDFARTGLLYIFESASKSDELEQWLVESDIPTMMATGLGALYSQLSRKLSIIHPELDIPVVLKLSDYKELDTAAEDAESFFSPNLKLHMDTFLSYLTFWQDVLEHCNSLDVRQTLLDHFQVLFLQQLLYPTLLESSDADGGSSVAVLTYLRCILEALDHPEVIHMMLQYLLGVPQDMSASSPRLLRRRESLMLLTKDDREDDQIDPSLFSMIDLILNSLQSNNPQSIVAALRLVSIIISKNHAYAIGTLVKVSMTNSPEIRRTHGSLNAEMEAYLNLAKNVGDAPGIEALYDNHLKDASRLLESHACSAELLKVDELGKAPKLKRRESNLIRIQGPRPHHLSPDDSMFRFLLHNLDTFLTNNVEVNLGLTETFITLASCGLLKLEGWLSVEPSKYLFNEHSDVEASVASLTHSALAIEDEPEEKDAMTALELARRRPKWYRRNTPPLLACLEDIHEELKTVRDAVPDFDVLLSARRQVFNLYDAISDVIANEPPALRPRDASPAKPSPAQQSLSGHLLSDLEQTVANSPSTRYQKGLNLAQRMLADYERGTPAEPSSNNSSLSKTESQSPRTPRAQSRGNAPPVTPTPRDRRNLALGAQLTPQSRSRTHSPMPRPFSPDKNQLGREPKELLNDVIREANAVALKRRFRFATRQEKAEEEGERNAVDTEASDPPAEPPQTYKPAETDKDKTTKEKKKKETKKDEARRRTGRGLREATLGHILTNVVILQEFELELVAIMQVRASMFGEVRFA